MTYYGNNGIEKDPTMRPYMMDPVLKAYSGYINEFAYVTTTELYT